MDILSYILGMKSVKESAGGESSGEKSFEIKSGNFRPTANTETISHGCGVLPDIIVVYSNHVPQAGYLIFSLGFSTALHTALGGGWIAPTITLASSGSIGYKSDLGIETSQPTGALYGSIRNATESLFTIGGGNGKLKIGELYSWICICGIT